MFKGGLNHYHQRKRFYEKYEPIPSKDRTIRFMDRAIYVVGVAGPIMTIPQVWEIWINKNAAGVSALTWGSYLILAFFWLFYGIIHKEKPIVFTNVLWIVLQTIIVIGVLMY